MCDLFFLYFTNEKLPFCVAYSVLHGLMSVTLKRVVTASP